MPSHMHRLGVIGGDRYELGPWVLHFKYETGKVESYGQTTNSEAGETGGMGGSQPHNNLQPYITTYMWKRTA